MNQQSSTVNHPVLSQCPVCATMLSEEDGSCPHCRALQGVRKRYQGQVVAAFGVMVAGYAALLSGAVLDSPLIITIGVVVGFACAVWFMVALYCLFKTGV